MIALNEHSKEVTLQGNKHMMIKGSRDVVRLKMRQSSRHDIVGIPIKMALYGVCGDCIVILVLKSPPCPTSRRGL